MCAFLQRSLTNVDAVRSLLLAVELGSFSAAAERQSVSPSTVSWRVSELEAALDCRLFNVPPVTDRPAAAPRRP